MSHKMSPRKTRAQSKAAETTIATVTPIASPFPESLLEDEQTSQCSAVDLPSSEVPVEVPLPLKSLSKDQNTLQNLVGEEPKDLLAVGTPHQEQSTTESLPEDPNPAAKLTAILSAEEIPFDDPLVRESLTTSLQLESPLKCEQTKEAPAGDQQTAEDPTEKVLEDSLTLESVSNDKQIADTLTTSLSRGGVSKKLIQSIPKDQPMVEDPSTDIIAEVVPVIKPATEAFPISEEQLDVPMVNKLDHEPQDKVSPHSSSSGETSDVFIANSNQESQKNPSLNPPSSGIIKPSKRKVPVIDLTSDSEDEPEQDTRHGLSKRTPSVEAYNIEYSEQNGQQIRKKRRVGYTTTGTKLQAPAIPSTPEGSSKAFESASRSRRKANTQFTSRDFSKHIDDESKWFEGISKRVDNLTKHVKQQKECTEAIDSLQFGFIEEVAKLSAESMSKGTRKQIRERLESLEVQQGKKVVELRQLAFSTMKEGNLIKTDLASWRAKEQKVTEQIEKSR